jgi:hypothetical protein
MERRAETCWYNLFISDKYIKDWDSWTGIRETYQNFIDGLTKKVKELGGNKSDLQSIQHKRSVNSSSGEREEFYEFTYEYQPLARPGERYNIGSITYTPYNKELKFKNPGSIPIAGITLGGTAKAETDDEICGKHGEGLKLTALTLLRAGMFFSIETGKELWEFKLAHDRDLTGETCLYFKRTFPDSLQAITESNYCVTAIIEGISINQWNEACTKLLPLTYKNIGKVDAYQNPSLGSLVLANNMGGKMHVKGIYVNSEATSTPSSPFCGYNFIQLDLDRDRRSIPDVWNRNEKSSQLHANIANNYQQLKLQHGSILNNYFEKIYDALSHNNYWVHFIFKYLNPVTFNKFFELFQHYNSDKQDVQPCYSGRESGILQKLQEYGLNKDFYLYTSVSDRQWLVLTRSQLYETIDTRVNRRLKQLPEAILTDAQKLLVQQTATEIRKYAPTFQESQIKFKDYAISLKYKENNLVYLSMEIFDRPKSAAEFPNSTRPIVAKIFSDTFKLLNLSLQELITALI